MELEKFDVFCPKTLWLCGYDARAVAQRDTPPANQPKALHQAGAARFGVYQLVRAAYATHDSKRNARASLVGRAPRVPMHEGGRHSGVWS
ncbi:MAG: hypothetical protein EON54_00615 [Alcaligenaceae bacterium]|nr:MAG: hypothetical protein EON54_00615 [Alcaligenaceae bacterium]